MTLYLVKDRPTDVYLPVPEGGTIAPEEDCIFIVRTKTPVADRGGLHIVLTCIQSGRHSRTLTIRDELGNALWQTEITCHVFYLGLQTDVNRDGSVTESETGASWTWGRKGQGAIVLVNPDPHTPENLIATPERLQRLAPLVIAPTGYTEPIPKEVCLLLYTTPNAATRMTVYRKTGNKLQWILGQSPSQATDFQITISDPINPDGETFFVESLQYPGGALSAISRGTFEGLLTFELHLRVIRPHAQTISSSRITSISANEPGKIRRSTFAHDQIVLEREVIGVTSAVYRVAPWITVPDTQMANTVYVMAADPDSDGRFVAKLREKCIPLGADVVELPLIDKNDFWIQDKVQFGYSEFPRPIIGEEPPKAPTLIENVVCSSSVRPPNPDDLGSDIGVMQVLGNGIPGALDGFGNLECSPPVKVKRKVGKRIRTLSYPLGRVIFGGRGYGELADAREMMPLLRRFLYAQKVQSPIEIYTDWLEVGHADEIVSFVPFPSPTSSKGFKLLLPSPARALNLLAYALDREPNIILFENLRRCSTQPDIGDATVTAEALLNDPAFIEVNERSQRYINFNRSILMDELGLGNDDILDIPALFTRTDYCKTPSVDFEDKRIAPFMPNMVNHLVLGRTSLMPRPHGPRIKADSPRPEDKCVFETDVYNTMKRIDRDVDFIDDWFHYYINMGDVHCATNTLRQPINVKWWKCRPDEGFDILEPAELVGRETASLG